ncbi:hypothetical protein BGX26_009037 [Mortierella sp. AD094]|nr:hypothetical protein BGX26_009037 [Mortierella sp. AD094]
MGKLTSLLKKKKTRGDDSTPGLQGNASSTMSGSSYEISVPLSLCIPSSDAIKVDVSTSLMDDIMGELAGTTPDTPQPSQTNSKPDFDDFGLAFELSRQLDLGESQNDSKVISSSGPAKVGRLEQNSAFKENTFLRSQQQQLRSGPSPTPTISAPYRQTSNIYGASTTNTSANATTKNASPYLKLSAKEAEEKAEVAAKLREASKKANNQLPSDDEGSETSDSDDSEDENEAERQQQLQQQQQQLQQHQQLQQEQDAGKTESLRRDDNMKKARPINPEDVINRMKDRHRAVIAGAAAAAREEYYEEYMDEYGHLQQLQPQGPLGYSMQYGIDPTAMYGIDDYRMQQQQLYHGQSVPPHMHHPTNAQYGHSPMNLLIPGYNYNTPGPVPNYIPTMQGPMYSTCGAFPNQLAGFRREQRPSISGSSDSSSHPLSHVESISLSRRGSRQYRSILSTRTSEDSWTDPSSVFGTSEQKTIPSDSGCSGTTEQGKNSIDEALEEEEEKEEEDTQSESDYGDGRDDVAKVIEVLAIAKANIEAKAEASLVVDKSHEDATEIDVEGQMFDEPESLKSSTLVDSISCLKDVATTVSSTPSARGGNDDDDGDSSDDDQPIILSRRGPFLPIKPTIPSGLEYHDESLIAPISSQMPYMQHASVYQPQAMPYIPQQHQYVPMGYQFPAPPNPPNMGHHHTYSLDRGTSVMMSGPHSTVPGAPGIGTSPLPHTARRGAAYPQVGPKDPRQNVMPPGTGPVQLQYPIPATTLLHPLPRRSQSVRVPTRNMGPSIPRSDSPSRQQQQQQQQQSTPQPQLSRPRGSVEYVRLPNGGYQSIGGPEYNGNNNNGPYICGYSESLSPPNQQQQHHQQMMSPPMAQALLEKQQQFQQGFYMAPTHVGYPMHHDLYTHHPHQQILQASRR